MGWDQGDPQALSQQAAPNLAKTSFHKTLGHPRPTALCYFIQNSLSSVSLADTEAFMGKKKKKNNNHF